MESRTVGLSPKAVLAFLFPLISALVGAAASWAIGGFGSFDTTSVVIAATGVAASGVALLGAYVGKPGSVTPAKAAAPAAAPVAYSGAAVSSGTTASVWTEPRPGAAVTNKVTPLTASPGVAPFTPDGDPADDEPDTDPLADTPDESWVADKSDKHGSGDHPQETSS